MAPGRPPRTRRPGIHAPSAWLLLGPAVVALLVWMVVPLALTVYYSFRDFHFLYPQRRGFAGISNYASLLRDPDFWGATVNTLWLVGATLVITVVLGLALALLYNQDFPGRGVARTLAISPFFVMPVVGALIWKNMLMHPVYGLFAYVQRQLGMEATDWLAHAPMTSVIVMLAWAWIPFALLVLLTGLQSLPKEHLEAARLDGAGPWAEFRYIVAPYLARPISVVVMLESIFFLIEFARIYTATAGGPGIATTNLTYFIYLAGFSEWNIGRASAGAVFAVILANVVAIFLLRFISQNLAEEAPR